LEMSSQLFDAENDELEAIDDPSGGLAFVTVYLEQRRAVAEEIAAAVAAIAAGLVAPPRVGPPDPKGTAS
ncbi:MAG: hypothetical protein WCA82_10240, partial [Jiangellales bacterium]